MRDETLSSFVLRSNVKERQPPYRFVADREVAELNIVHRENQLADEASRLRRRRKGWLDDAQSVLREVCSDGHCFGLSTVRWKHAKRYASEKRSTQNVESLIVCPRDSLLPTVTSLRS